MEITRRKFASIISFFATPDSRSPFLHRLHDAAVFHDRCAHFLRQRLNFVAQAVDLVALIGDEIRQPGRDRRPTRRAQFGSSSLPKCSFRKSARSTPCASARRSRRPSRLTRRRLMPYI
ncbi:MAG: hypothetical protein WDM89_11635 [Rhizomicrobium sp.]